MMKKIVRSSWLALVLLFMYLPVVILAVYSFTDTATIGTSGHFSLQNYKTLFTTGELLSMIGGTFALAFGSALIATIWEPSEPSEHFTVKKDLADLWILPIRSRLLMRK